MQTADKAGAAGGAEPDADSDEDDEKVRPDKIVLATS